MKWETSCLGEICRVGDGAHASLKREKDGIPYVTAKNLLGNRIDYSKMDYISTDTYKKYFKESSTALTRPQKDDILFSIIGSIGGLYLIKKDELFGLSSSVAIFRTKEETVFPKYLFYYMNSTMFDNKIQSVRGGVAQGFLSLSKLESIEIEYPQSIEYQKSIVNHLERFDELIDKNQNQIKLLEEAAQRLYKEWFIDIRFPGHETTPIVNGIPDGWKRDRADSFFDITIGKTPPRAESQWFVNNKNGIQWVSISDMGKSGAYIFETAEGLTTEAVEKYNVKIIPADTVLVSFKLTVGRVSITTENMCTNEAIAHFRVDKELRDYTYLYLKSFEYDNLGNTSAISKAVNSKIIKAMPFIMPDKSTLINFERLIAPIMNEIYDKSLQIKQLTEARDRLLPKLMSGEIEV